MIDERDLLDPAENFTQSQSLASGAKMPEYTIRQLLGAVMRQLRETVDEPNGILDELFKSVGAEALRQIKGFVREHPNIPVQVNWPRHDLHLPWICVLNQGEQEEKDFAFLGDRGGTVTLGTFGGRKTSRPQLIVGERRSLEIVVGTQDPDLTMYLHYIVKRAIFVNKMALIEHADVQNLMVSGRDLSLDSSVYPTFGYFKSVSLQFQTTFDYNGGETAGAIVGVGLLVDALAGGASKTSGVPE